MQVSGKNVGGVALLVTEIEQNAQTEIISWFCDIFEDFQS